MLACKLQLPVDPRATNVVFGVLAASGLGSGPAIGCLLPTLLHLMQQHLITNTNEKMPMVATTTPTASGYIRAILFPHASPLCIQCNPLDPNRSNATTVTMIAKSHKSKSQSTAARKACAQPGGSPPPPPPAAVALVSYLGCNVRIRLPGSWLPTGTSPMGTDCTLGIEGTPLFWRTIGTGRATDVTGVRLLSLEALGLGVLEDTGSLGSPSESVSVGGTHGIGRVSSAPIPKEGVSPSAPGKLTIPEGSDEVPAILLMFS